MKFIYLFISVLVLVGCQNKKNRELTLEEIEVPTYNFEEFKKEIAIEEGKVYVINFWATWCAPCVEELPFFLELDKKEDIEVVLVSLDMPSMKETQLKPFIIKKNVTSKVVLLDDLRSSIWMPEVDENWDGAIPATLLINGGKKAFYARRFEDMNDLLSVVNKIKN
ncbi:TlpA family protein disulfide reductase [Mesonia phycicola]|nr:TlpA disulfide reductase family protein [Mesonia phycicola]